MGRLRERYKGLCVDRKDIIFTFRPKTDLEARINISNPSNKRCRFQWIASCPQRYAIIPTNGIIHPGETIEIKVKLMNCEVTPENLIGICERFTLLSYIMSNNEKVSDIISLVKKKNQGYPIQILKFNVGVRSHMSFQKCGIPRKGNVAGPSGCSRQERSTSEYSLSVFDTIDSLIEAKVETFIIDEKIKVSKQKSEGKTRNKKYRKKDSSVSPTHKTAPPPDISPTEINQTCRLNDLILRDESRNLRYRKALAKFSQFTAILATGILIGRFSNMIQRPRKAMPIAFKFIIE